MGHETDHLPPSGAEVKNESSLFHIPSQCTQGKQPFLLNIPKNIFMSEGCCICIISPHMDKFLTPVNEHEIEWGTQNVKDKFIKYFPVLGGWRRFRTEELYDLYLTSYYQSDQIKHEIGRACGMYGVKRNAYTFLVGKL
jgi:hypothetical protein